MGPHLEKGSLQMGLSVRIPEDIILDLGWALNTVSVLTRGAFETQRWPREDRGRLSDAAPRQGQPGAPGAVRGLADSPLELPERAWPC